MTAIVCRARVSAACLHEQPTAGQFGEDGPLSEDGTFDGTSIVCDPCYIALMPLTPSGQALNHELPDAISQARKGATA